MENTTISQPPSMRVWAPGMMGCAGPESDQYSQPAAEATESGRGAEVAQPARNSAGSSGPNEADMNRFISKLTVAQTLAVSWALG